MRLAAVNNVGTRLWNLINSGTWTEQAILEVGKETGLNAIAAAGTGEDILSDKLSVEQQVETAIDGAGKLAVTTVAVASVVEDATAMLANEGFAAARAGADGLVDIYRAVGPAELADIRSTGTFRTPAGVAEGKYFTTTGESASLYACQACAGFGDPPYNIVRTQVPESLLRTPGIHATVDRGIPAYVIPNHALPGLRPQILNYSPLPRRLR